METGPLLEGYLQGKTVHNLFFDKDKNLWMGTQNNGVFLLPYSAFPVYNIEGLDNQGDHPRKLATDNKSIWGICKDGNLLHIDEKGKISQKYFPELKGFKDCYIGKTGKLIVGSDYSMFELDLESNYINRLSEYTYQGDFQSPICPKDLIYLDGYIYLGNCSRFLKVDPVHKVQKVLFKGRVVSLLYDTLQTTFWFSSLNGIHRYKIGSEAELVIDKNGFNLSQMAYCMAKDGDGNIYFGTHGKGLWRYKDSLFTKVNEEFGIEANSFSDLLFSKNWLWTTSEKGLIKINLQTKESIRVHGPRLNGEMYNLTQTGNSIWVSSSNGIIKLPAAPSTKRDSNSRVFLESFMAQDEEGRINKDFTLTHKFNRITVDFSSPVYTENTVYRYRLNGGSWQSIDKPPLLLSALKPGAYQLEITNRRKGEPSEEETLHVNFEIDSPWWWRLESILLMSLIGGLSIFFLVRNFYRRRFQRFQERERMLREIEVLRLRALQAQMNPHFTFNALNAIQEQLLKHDSISAVNYLSDFARLIRKTLDMVDKAFIGLDEEIEFLQTYIRLELLRHENPINISWHIDPRIKLSQWIIPPMLVQPLIENAFKHGLSSEMDSPSIKIAFHVQDEKLLISVEDNGVGLQKSSQMATKINGYQSKGLSLIRNRLSLLPVKENEVSSLILEDLSQKAPSLSGTRACITIPLSQCKN